MPVGTCSPRSPWVDADWSEGSSGVRRPAIISLHGVLLRGPRQLTGDQPETTKVPNIRVGWMSQWKK